MFFARPDRKIATAFFPNLNAALTDLDVSQIDRAAFIKDMTMQTAARIEEPPGRPQYDANHNPRFTIMNDGNGSWIVNDSLGVVGGMFVNEGAALQFTRTARRYSNDQVVASDRAAYLKSGMKKAA